MQDYIDQRADRRYSARMQQAFREWLRESLDTRQWTTGDLERASGVNNSIIWRWLQDPPRRPTPANLKRIAKPLNVPYEDLMRLCGYLPETAATATPTPAHTDPRIARILELLPGVPSERLDAIEQHVSLAVQPVRGRAKARTSGAANGLLARRAEIRNGTEDAEENGSKRRQFQIASLSTWFESVILSLIASLGLNRDSGVAARPA